MCESGRSLVRFELISLPPSIMPGKRPVSSHGAATLLTAYHVVSLGPCKLNRGKNKVSEKV